VRKRKSSLTSGAFLIEIVCSSVFTEKQKIKVVSKISAKVSSVSEPSHLFAALWSDSVFSPVKTKFYYSLIIKGWRVIHMHILQLNMGTKALADFISFLGNHKSKILLFFFDRSQSSKASVLT
jgi:hypothetical protein